LGDKNQKVESLNVVTETFQKFTDIDKIPPSLKSSYDSSTYVNNDYSNNNTTSSQNKYMNDKQSKKNEKEESRQWIDLTHSKPKASNTITNKPNNSTTKASNMMPKN